MQSVCSLLHPHKYCLLYISYMRAACSAKLQPTEYSATLNPIMPYRVLVAAALVPSGHSVLAISSVPSSTNCMAREPACAKARTVLRNSTTRDSLSRAQQSCEAAAGRKKESTIELVSAHGARPTCTQYAPRSTCMGPKHRVQSPELVLIPKTCCNVVARDLCQSCLKVRCVPGPCADRRVPSTPCSYPGSTRTAACTMGPARYPVLGLARSSPAAQSSYQVQPSAVPTCTVRAPVPWAAC